VLILLITLHATFCVSPLHTLNPCVTCPTFHQGTFTAETCEIWQMDALALYNRLITW